MIRTRTGERVAPDAPAQQLRELLQLGRLAVEPTPTLHSDAREGGGNAENARNMAGCHMYHSCASEGSSYQVLLHSTCKFLHRFCFLAGGMREAARRRGAGVEALREAGRTLRAVPEA